MLILFALMLRSAWIWEVAPVCFGHALLILQPFPASQCRMGQTSPCLRSQPWTSPGSSGSCRWWLPAGCWLGGLVAVGMPQTPLAGRAGRHTYPSDLTQHLRCVAFHVPCPPCQHPTPASCGALANLTTSLVGHQPPLNTGARPPPR